MNLPKSEEQVIQIIWDKEQVFMKDLIDAYPEPKPAASTIATLLKRLLNKGAIGFQQFGNVRAYHAIWKKEDYFSNHFDGVIKDFFNGSVSQFASFFTSKGKLTEDQLRELKKIVDEQIETRKK